MIVINQVITRSSASAQYVSGKNVFHQDFGEEASLVIAAYSFLPSGWPILIGARQCLKKAENFYIHFWSPKLSYNISKIGLEIDKLGKGESMKIGEEHT